MKVKLGKSKQETQPTLGQQWLLQHAGRKAEVINNSVGDDLEKAAVAKMELLLAYGLSSDPESFEAFIMWAHNPSIQPEDLDVDFLSRHGYICEMTGMPKQSVFQALGIMTKESDARELSPDITAA